MRAPGTDLECALKLGLAASLSVLLLARAETPQGGYGRSPCKPQPEFATQSASRTRGMEECMPGIFQVPLHPGRLAARYLRNPAPGHGA
jgi:hypothetical protein